MIDQGRLSIYINDKIAPSERAMSQLRTIAAEKHIESPLVALPDIHDKKDNDFPTGIVAASKDRVFPQLLVSGVNCGMRMMAVPILYDGLPEEEIDRLFKYFVKRIRTRGYASETLNRKEIIDIMRKGALWVAEKNGSPKDEVAHIEKGGNAFGSPDIDPDTITSAIPKTMLEVARFRLGFLGKGNHFLEMQVVEEIFDEGTAVEFGLKKNQILLLLHSGSGGLGSMVGHLYTPRAGYTKQLKMRIFIALERIKSAFRAKNTGIMRRIADYERNAHQGLFSLEADSAEAGQYLIALSAASNFGYANRQYLADQAGAILAQNFSLKRSDIRTLYDMSHISIERETHGKARLWVHRSGATRAFTPDMLSDDSKFKKTGEPVFLPGSMGDSTYLCVSNSGNSRTFFSAGHGSGRRRASDIAPKTALIEDLKKKLLTRKVRLYKGLSGSIVDQDPDCFKDIEATLRAYTENGLLKAVLKTRPVAVLKG